MGGLGTPPGALHRNFEENGASRTKDRYSGFHSLTIFYMMHSRNSRGCIFEGLLNREDEMMAVLLLLGCLPGAAALYERKVYSIDRSWRFSLCEDDACAQGSPASCPEGAWCAASLDDDAWRRVDVGAASPS